MASGSSSLAFSALASSAVGLLVAISSGFKGSGTASSVAADGASKLCATSVSEALDCATTFSGAAACMASAVCSLAGATSVTGAGAEGVIGAGTSGVVTVFKGSDAASTGPDGARIVLGRALSSCKVSIDGAVDCVDGA